MNDAYLAQARHVPASRAAAKWFTSVIHSASYRPTRRAGLHHRGRGRLRGPGPADVAIPVQQIQLQDDGEFVLPGATKDAIKSLPRF